jgi:hypothetical protein
LAEKDFKKSVMDDVMNKTEKTKQEKDALYETMTTGVRMYDKIVGKAIESDVGRKILSSYLKFLGLFKSSKIGGNLLVASVNSIFGNLSMTGMAGIDIANGEFIGSLGKALGAVTGKNLEAIERLTTNRNWKDIIEKYPEVFQAVFGLDPQFVLNGRKYIDDFAKNLADNLAVGIGKESINGQSEVVQAFNKLMASSGNDFYKGVIKGLPKFRKDIISKGVSPTESILRRGVPAEQLSSIQSPGVATTNISTDILMGPYGEFIKDIKKAADADKPFAKAFYWLLTKPMKAYEKVDQTYKLGTALHLTENGITEKELRLLAKRFAISPQDVTAVKGRNLWLLSPDKAMEVSNEIYMNYLAMPGFVKMMRSLPILGSPFMSFAYGSSALTLKAGMYNPSFFNKVNFLLKEISGDRSPLEKRALKEPYFNWYDREGMVKLPFFKENPVYLNAANMLTYYTLNMFQPVERDYGSKLGDTMAKFVDKTPFFKTPEGQLLMDYAILPMITGEAQGQFGQPLWPSDAKLPEKLGRAGLTAAETLVPPMAGFAGLVTPEALLPYAPSYRWRKLGYATKGKSALGIPGKEPAGERTLREIAALSGFPTYKMNLSFTNPDKKKTKKK